MDSSTASMLMIEPKHSKAFSDLYGSGYRRDEINKFKSQSDDIISILDEKTPFDLYENNLALQVIDERLQAIYGLIRSNPDLTREYVEQAILPIQDMIELLDDKINILLPKRRNKRNVLPLRDPINTELFDVFINAAGSTYQRQKDLKSAQLKIAYTILFFVGLRVNEIRFFQEKNIQDTIKTAQFNVIHFKQKEPHIHIISDLAVQELKKLKCYYEIIFVKYKYKYLFGKDKPIGEKSLIRAINNDLKRTCELNKIPYNIKSHSFRVNIISKLLQNTSVQDAANIIGHRDIKSTMAYKRYALNKKEIKDLLNKIDKQKKY
nr:putative integrase/recombinase protein [Navicula sp.]